MKAIVLALQLVFSGHVEPPIITYAVVERDTASLVIVTYPLGRLQKACTVQYAFGSDLETARHCWVPTNEIADFDWWDDLQYLHQAAVYFVCYVEVRRPDGGIDVLFAYPIEGDS